MKQRFDIAIVLSLIVFVTWLQQPCNGVGVPGYEDCRNPRPTDLCKQVFETKPDDCFDFSFWGLAKLVHMFITNKVFSRSNSQTDHRLLAFVHPLCPVLSMGGLGKPFNHVKIFAGIIAHRISCENDCRVTCKNCSAYNCVNPLPHTLLDCEALESECEDLVLAPLLQRKCPATCGTCKVENPQHCKDVSSTETCVQLKALCDTHDDYAWMTTHCPSTCKRCQENVIINGQCKDAIPNCLSYLAHCDDPVYNSVMQIQCNKTCNKCSTTVTPVTPPGLCVDSSKCATWIANGFCTNSQYSEENKRKYCPVSCNLCP